MNRVAAKPVTTAFFKFFSYRFWNTIFIGRNPSVGWFRDLNTNKNENTSLWISNNFFSFDSINGLNGMSTLTATFSRLPFLLPSSGFVHTFGCSESLLVDILRISAENVGRAGIIGDRQHTLPKLKKNHNQHWFSSTQEHLKTLTS